MEDHALTKSHVQTHNVSKLISDPNICYMDLKLNNFPSFTNAHACIYTAASSQIYSPDI